MPSPKFETFQLNLSDRVYVEAKLLWLGPLLGVPNHKVGAEITNKSREGISAATGKVLNIWLGRHETTDEKELIQELHEAFKDPELALQQDFLEVYETYCQRTSCGDFLGVLKPTSGRQGNGNVNISGQMNSPASGVDVMDTTSFEGAGNGAWNCDALPESTRFNVPDLTGPQSYKKQKLLGKAAVFNIASTLPGADKDEQRVLEVLPQIGFKANDIYTCRYTNYSELETALTEHKDDVANADYSQSACVLVWVLGHGSRFYIDTAKGTRPMLISDILSMFKEKKSLSGKPKIFIFETCHGSGRDFGHEIERSKESWPIEADVAVYYAAPDGYAALVHPVSGSRFTQCLCSALEEYDKREHFVDIATMTNHMVASIENQSGRKQVPMLQHTLTKRFYFFQPK